MTAPEAPLSEARWILSAKVQPPPRWMRANQDTCIVGTVKLVCGLQALSAPGPSGGTRTPETGSSGESWPYTPSSLSSHTVRFTPVCGTRQDTLRYAVHTASAPREAGACGLRARRKHQASSRAAPQPPRQLTRVPGGGPMACSWRETPAGARCEPGGEPVASSRRAASEVAGCLRARSCGGQATAEAEPSRKS